MKRSAAILGPTPAFLRWAIDHRCPLREPSERNVADTAFRQLRSIQELSIAYSEERVIDGIAIHRNVEPHEDLLGFPVEEITAAYGGKEFVESSCIQCAANTFGDQGWAGCFGLVILNQAIAETFESGLDESARESLTKHFEATLPAWYGLWTDPFLKKERLQALLSLIQKNDPMANLAQSLDGFCKAIEICIDHDLSLHVSLHPPGFSDGLTWKLNPHCESCKFHFPGEDAALATFADRPCPCCREGTVTADRKKRKVLGIRPYMRLINIVGEEVCADLYQQSVKRTNS